MPKIESASNLLFTLSGPPLGNISKIKKRLNAAMREAASAEGGEVAPFVLHDLRRTTVTGMAELGIRPDLIELLINHVSGHRSGVAGTYNRAERIEEKRAALARWATHIEGLVTKRTARVTPLRGLQ